MPKRLKFRQTGGSVSLTIPREMAERLNADGGEGVFATEVKGGVLLTPFDEELAIQLEAGAAFMKKYREVFRRLASA